MSLASNILLNNHTFAVVGVSQDPEKYGHEVFEALRANGYMVYPINPKYDAVDGHRCYPALDALPEKPDVVVTVVSPVVTEKIVETCAQLVIGAVWMPPETWSEKAVETCAARGIREVHDICPIFALQSLQN